MTRPVMLSGDGGYTVAERNPATDLVRTLQGRSSTQIRFFLNVSLVSSGCLPKNRVQQNPVVRRLSRRHGLQTRDVEGADRGGRAWSLPAPCRCMRSCTQPGSL